MSNLIKSFTQARKVAVPLVAIQTPDPAQTIASLMSSFGKSAPPMIQWDFSRGPTALNQYGFQAMSLAMNGASPDEFINPGEFLRLCQQFPGDNPDSKTRGAIVFLHNFHRLVEDNPQIIQGVWNLRDPYKGNRRTLVLLGPSFNVPAELANDLLVLDEPLPTEQEAEKIVREAYLAGGEENPDDDSVVAAVEGVKGLSAFAAEQSAVLSMIRGSDKQVRIDADALWERKRKIIESTPGLSILQTTEASFDNIGGCDNIKGFIRKLKSDDTGIVVFIDEIEKGLAGSTGSVADSSGTSQAILGELLRWMQDYEVEGLLELGVPGSGKTEIGKCTGGYFGKMTVSLVPSHLKGGIVGQTEGNVKQALKIINSLSKGKPFCIATCNSLSNLPPELRRRFTFGTWFFDLPTESERKAIWSIYLQRYGIGEDKTKLPDDTNWTGAEIKNCAKLARRLGITPREAAQYIVPTATSMGEDLDKLRDSANGRFISASESGIYRKPLSGGIPQRQPIRARAAQSAEQAWAD